MITKKIIFRGFTKSRFYLGSEPLEPVSYTLNYSVITGSDSIALGQIKLVLRKNTTEFYAKISQSCENSFLRRLNVF